MCFLYFQFERNHLADQRSKGSGIEPNYEPYKVEDLNYKQKIGFDMLTEHLRQAVDESTPDPEQLLVSVDGKLHQLQHDFTFYFLFTLLTNR